jgi:hypothetical protein
MVNRNTTWNKQECKDKRKDAHDIFRQKKVLFISKLEQMEIAYNNNETKKFYQEVNSIRKGLKLQT